MGCHPRRHRILRGNVDTRIFRPNRSHCLDPVYKKLKEAIIQKFLELSILQEAIRKSETLMV